MTFLLGLLDLLEENSGKRSLRGEVFGSVAEAAKEMAMQPAFGVLLIGLFIALVVEAEPWWAKRHILWREKILRGNDTEFHSHRRVHFKV